VGFENVVNVSNMAWRGERIEFEDSGQDRGDLTTRLRETWNIRDMILRW
jgi:hypothetical protein